MRGPLDPQELELDQATWLHLASSSPSP